MKKHLVSLVALALPALVLAGSLGPGRSLASSPPAQSVTYLYTGAEQTFAVPTNVTGVSVVIVGAKGASCCGAGSTEAGGAGGRLTGDIPLPPGTATLYVEVGGDGGAGPDPTKNGGWNGGGGGPLGGGGASDVRTISCSTSGGDCASGGSPGSLVSRLAISGGGGGASAAAPGGSSQNSGGFCQLCGSGGEDSSAGLALTQAQVTTYCKGLAEAGGVAGGDGVSSQGGVGGYLFVTGAESGGGGGGLYGGGGGGQCYQGTGTLTATADAGAGGGGSNLPPNSRNWGIQNADTVDPAEVIISYPFPTATTAPGVAGSLAVGDVLGESHAQWAGATPSTYTYQWQRCSPSGTDCTSIAGATGQNYELVAADLGDTLRVQESASNFYGSSLSPSASAVTGVVGEPPSPTASPTISGTPTEGQVLQETHASWTDGPIAAFGYQWLRCNGGSCTAIGGAVDQSYTLAVADVGSTIEVQETAANAYGTSAPSTSVATAAVQEAPAPTFAQLGVTSGSAKGVRFAVLCRAAAGTVCKGAARLTTLERRRRGKVVGLSAGAKRHGKRAVVGSRRFTLASGARKKLVVPLNRTGARLLARFHRIPATLTIVLLDSTPHPEIAAHVTIRARGRH